MQGFGRPTMNTMKRVALVCLILLLSVTIRAQKPEPKPDDPFKISVDVNLVLLNVSVFDKKGHEVPGLTENDFQIEEDGQPQEIRDFHPEDSPATVGLVIDNSGSMLRKRQDVVAAAMEFISSSNPLDEVFLINFNDFVSFALPPSIPYTSNLPQLETALLKE